jgi:hypothetical protein
MEWILANKVEIWAAIGTIVIAASTIVKMTPTKKDDNFWAKYIKPVLNILAINPKEEKK